jgi:hypothetical protein
MDPAIEESFVLRIISGHHCDYLRKIIENGELNTSPLRSARPDWLHRRRRSRVSELAPRDRVQMHGSKGGEGPFASAPDVIIFKVLKVRITLDARKTVGTAPMLTFYKKGNSTSNTIE